jgi:hypothetical protein
LRKTGRQVPREQTGSPLREKNTLLFAKVPLGSLQERPELFSVPTPTEGRVWIVTLWQQDAKGHDAVCAKAVGELLCSLLSALVGVDIEGEIDGALAITQLVELGIIQMGA